MFPAVLLVAPARVAQTAGNERLRKKRALVARLGITDPRYTRHRSMADVHSPFQDYPLSLEHFPSGSLVPPRRTSRAMGALDRHFHILDFTLLSLLRRKGKNLGLLPVYILVVFALASVMFFTQAIKREAAAVLQGAPDDQGSPAPVPAGARVRLHGTLDRWWSLDGLRLEVGPNTRVDKSPAPGDYVRVRGIVGTDGEVRRADPKKGQARPS
jgi:hypothetical protein